MENPPVARQDASMSATTTSGPPRRRKPIAFCIAAVFALGAPTVYANIFVTNCNDAGTGSLRAAVAAAGSGDTVDATGLTCGTITLKTGAIVISKGGLTIDGPGMDKLVVNARYFYVGGYHQYNNPIFSYKGTGALTIENLSISYGQQVNENASSRGGCVYSKGNITLTNVSVSSCTAKTTGGSSYGGAVFAQGSVTLQSSLITANTVYDGPTTAGNQRPRGGGVFAGDGFYAYYSTISDNSCGSTGGLGYGGGVYMSSGQISLRNSTIARNSADTLGGGIFFYDNLYAPSSIVNSTISGNSANQVGGIYVEMTDAKTLGIYNSTIAFNRANKGGSGRGGVGISVAGNARFSPPINLESSLISNNTYQSTDSDLAASEETLSGNNNLVFASSANLPSDTIVGKCPLLGPLRNNGGPTFTHALLSASPAIAKGNDNITPSLSFDQRGSPFARISSGPPGGTAPTVPDIGAYEVQQNDVIFNASFEGCP